MHIVLTSLTSLPASPLPFFLPSSPPYPSKECGLNVHKRCQDMVSPNCGINQKEMAKVLSEMQLKAGELSHQSSRRKKVTGSPSTGSVSSTHSSQSESLHNGAIMLSGSNGSQKVHGSQLKVADFVFLKVLGKGSFGKVCTCLPHSTSPCFGAHTQCVCACVCVRACNTTCMPHVCVFVCICLTLCICCMCVCACG